MSSECLPVLLLVCCPCVRTGAADAGSIGSVPERNKNNGRKDEGYEIYT